jgi:Cu/Ag efflux protein CusF
LEEIGGLRSAALTAAALLVSVGVANAAEKDGKIKAIDAAKMTLTLEDGTMFYLSQSVAAKDLKTGEAVKVTFEAKDGKNTADKVVKAN